MTVYTFSISRPAGSLVSAGSDTAPLTYEPDHEAAALSRLLEQFHEKPRIEAILGRLMEMIQVAEDVSWQLARERYLDPIDGHGPAEGVLLDGLGRIVGEPRADRNDERYRAALRVRILVNKSDGKLEQLIDILSLLAEGEIRVFELAPAHLEVSVTEVAFPTDAFRYLKQAKASGVGLTFVYTSDPLDETFQVSGTYGTDELEEASTGWGSDYVANYGGKIAGVFQ